MSLSAFKTIYYWEWGHRLLGRLIGFAFLLPLIYFLVRGYVGSRLGGALFGLFLLGGAQGALGWYMVQSGLTERVDVSQYRLAAHMGFAIVLFAALFWTALAVRNPATNPVRWNGLGIGALVLTFGVFAQIILGAFVAGLRAGHTYTTWPLMDGQFFPEAYFDGGKRFATVFESIAAVQFNHRIGAYLVAAGAVWFYLVARNSAIEERARYLLYAVGAQVLLGIVTLISATPISLGLAHQGGALIVFAAALYTLRGAVTLPSYQTR